MNWKSIDQIAKSPDKQWYFNQKEVSVILGCCRQRAAAFLVENSVPFYMLGKEKKYFLAEVLEATERQRWKGAAT